MNRCDYLKEHFKLFGPEQYSCSLVEEIIEDLNINKNDLCISDFSKCDYYQKYLKFRRDSLIKKRIEEELGKSS